MPSSKFDISKLGLRKATPTTIPPTTTTPRPTTTATTTTPRPTTTTLRPTTTTTSSTPRPATTTHRPTALPVNVAANADATAAADECDAGLVVKTRQQETMAAAIAHIIALGPNADIKKTYGGLCHTFPILVRQNGLCQALAFIADKKTPGDPQHPGSAEQAHQKLWEHIAATLGVNANPPSILLNRAYGSDIGVYLHDTRVLLDAWIFYKRFAVSLLGVTGSEDPE